MAATSTHDETLALVHEGWNHLMSQRPLAAWGTWQRALRLDPDATAARQAIEALEAAPELPLAARKVYRFRKPATEARRRGGTAFCATARPLSSLMPRRPSAAWPPRPPTTLRHGSTVRSAWRGPGWTARQSSVSTRSPAWPTATRRRPWKPGRSPRSSARQEVRRACPTTCAMRAPSPGAPSRPLRCGRRFPKSGRFPPRVIPRAPRFRLGISRCWSGSIVPFRRPRQSTARATSRACWPRFTSRRVQSGSPVHGSRRSSSPRRSCGGCWVPRPSRRSESPPRCHSPSWTPMSGPPGYLRKSIATLPTG